MRNAVTSSLAKWRDSFLAFSVGQKMAVLVGTAAIVLAGFLLVRWVTTPDMAPLYGNLSSQDASAVVEELDARGVAYELTDGGNTILVAKDDVYATRIALSGKGLPTNSDGGGYSLLDDNDLTTSTFGEQTAFKRAMEGELSKTVSAMDPVQSAVVHLALPARQVFADEQDPATASVLVRTELGRELGGEQVQAIVHLVASSIDGLDPADVTVADATGRVLTTDDTAAGAAGTRAQQAEAFSQRMRTQVQTMLDRVVGPGNSIAQVTADLDFDKATTERRTYGTDQDRAPLSESRESETYSGPGDDGGSSGVVGPDGQMDGALGADGDAAYEKESVTRDNAVDTTHEIRETAPGGVRSLAIGVTIDSRVAGTLDLTEVRKNIAAATGIDRARGDSLRVSTMPFDRSAEEAMNAELEAAEAADAAARRNAIYKNVALALGAGLVVGLILWQQRRKARARAAATSYVVEQLREDAAARAAVAAPAPTAAELALASSEANERSEQQRIQDELVDLVERQPDEVAALLRGWLVEQP